MSLLRFYQNLKRVGSTLKDGESLGNVVYRWYRNAGQLKAGRLVGADQFGNKYYEDDSDNINSVTGRERWVEYVNHGARNASQVPPEWHSWLHFTGDAPLNRPADRPYLAEYEPNHTGTENAYTPDNFMLNPNYDADQAKGIPKTQTLDKHSMRAKSLGFNVDDL